MEVDHGFDVRPYVDSDIHHIILVPLNGDTHGLLRFGIGGDRPPAAYWDDDWMCWNIWSYQDDQRLRPDLGWIHTRDRLLAYDDLPRFGLVVGAFGIPVAAGLARAQQATTPGKISWPSVGSLPEAIKQARVWAAMLDCRLVLVGSNGKALPSTDADG